MGNIVWKTQLLCTISSELSLVLVIFQDFLAGLLSSSADLGSAAGSYDMKQEEKSSIKPSVKVHGYGSSTQPPPKLPAPPANKPVEKVKSYHDDSDVVS